MHTLCIPRHIKGSLCSQIPCNIVPTEIECSSRRSFEPEVLNNGVSKVLNLQFCQIFNFNTKKCYFFKCERPPGNTPNILSPLGQWVEVCPEFLHSNFEKYLTNQPIKSNFFQNIAIYGPHFSKKGRWLHKKPSQMSQNGPRCF